MSTAEIPENPPTYDRLVEERGDVLGETRAVAEQTRRLARQIPPTARACSSGRADRAQRVPWSFPCPCTGGSPLTTAWRIEAGTDNAPGARALRTPVPAATFPVPLPCLGRSGALDVGQASAPSPWPSRLER